jgi:hypothetical protein
MTVNGVAIELECGVDWRGRVIYFASVAGIRRSFNTAHWAIEWAIQAVNAIRRKEAA